MAPDGSAANAISGSAPAVSVIIPAYNTAGTLARAVQSVLNQTVQDFEIILVEDCSTDATLEVAQQFAASDKRVRLIALPNNGGQARARNRGIAAASGEWVATLDADDRYQPDRLNQLLQAVKQFDVDMVADNQNHVDGDAGVLVRTAFPAAEGGREIGLTDFIASSDTAAEFSFGILKPMIRRSFIEQHQLGYRPGLRLGEDFYHLMQFFAAGGRGYLLNAPLYDWTLPFGPVSRRWTTTGDGAWRYDYRGTIAANQHFLRLMEAAGHLSLVALLRRREREYRVMVHYIDAQKAFAQSGRRARAAAIIASHPSTWPLLAQRITGRVRRAMLRQIA